MKTHKKTLREKPQDEEEGKKEEEEEGKRQK